jgi:hypothetical protein
MTTSHGRVFQVGNNALGLARIYADKPDIWLLVVAGRITFENDRSGHYTYEYEKIPELQKYAMRLVLRHHNEYRNPTLDLSTITDEIEVIDDEVEVIGNEMEVIGILPPEAQNMAKYSPENYRRMLESMLKSFLKK